MASTYCPNHPKTKATSICFKCKRHFCRACLTVGGDYYFCNSPDCQRAVADAPKAQTNKNFEEIDQLGFIGWNFRQKGMLKTAKVFSLWHVLWQVVLVIAIVVLGIASFFHYALVTVPVLLVLVTFWAIKNFRRK